MGKRMIVIGVFVLAVLTVRVFEERSTKVREQNLAYNSFLIGCMTAGKNLCDYEKDKVCLNTMLEYCYTQADTFVDYLNEKK